jgi:hypothetical protein
MTIEAACAYLGTIEREQFLRAVAPCLRPVKLQGGPIRFDRHELDAWVDNGGKLRPARTDQDWLNDVANAKD